MKRIFKNLMSLTLVLLMLPASMNVQVFAQGTDFCDIQGNGAAGIIEKWASKGIVQGYGDGTFRPDAGITRAELSKIINNLLELKRKSDVQFSDVSPKAWYAEELLKAKEAGYYEAASDNLAKPEELIGREAAAVVLVKALALGSQNTGTEGFKDAIEIAESSKGAVAVMVQKGLMRTYEDGSFKPSKSITRAEVVNIIDLADNSGIVAKAKVVSKFLKYTYTDSATGKTMPYRLFVPEGYDPNDRTKTYPLVLFLHGGGERGSDNQAQLIANEGATIWAKPEEQAKNPCFVLAPQATNIPSGGFGITRDADNKISLARVLEFSDDLKMAAKILDEVEKNYNVDKNRMYSTGLSQGGFGVWNLNMAYPDKFAAMVAICGGGDPAQAKKLISKPIWAFHAEADPIIPVSYTRNVIDAIKAAGGNPKYTEYPKEMELKPIAHFAWVPAYENAEMREWLFKQVKP